MLKSVVDSGVKGVRSSRIQPLSLLLLPRFHSIGRDEKQGDGQRPRIRQRRIATEVMEVVSHALQQGPCQNPLLQRCGFQLQYVKMSSDLRVAYIYWNALPGMERTAEKAVRATSNRIRSLVFERLNLPFSPMLRFEEDKLSPQALALEEAFAKLKEEEGEGQGESSPTDNESSSMSAVRLEAFKKLEEEEGEGGSESSEENETFSAPAAPSEAFAKLKEEEREDESESSEMENK